MVAVVLIAPASGSDRFSFNSLSQFSHTDAVNILDAHLLFSGEYTRSGRDLIISDHLHHVVLPNYFLGEKRPLLVSPEGAPLNSRFVDALTGYVEYAQAGAAAAAKVVGHVVKMTGSASIVRNGVAIVVNLGDTLNQNDVVQTGSNSTLGLVLDDGTTFNLSANARFMLNELNYDPNSTSNSSLMTLVQGAASFVAGQIAPTGDMKVATPVAVIGIRGTAVILDISSTDGTVSVSVVDQHDNRVHSVQVYDNQGVLVGTAASNGAALTLTPTATFNVNVQESNKTPDQVSQEFNVFQQVLSTYDAGKQLLPNLPQHTENTNPNNNTNPNSTKAAGSSTPPSELTSPEIITTAANSGEHLDVSSEPTVIVTALSSVGVNPTQSPSLPQVLITQALPTTVAITSPVAVGSIINQSEVLAGFTISGTATAGNAPVNGEIATITITNSSNVVEYTNTTTVTNGAWSVKVPAALSLADGSYSITATVLDTANNTAITATQVITVDTVPPIVTISTPGATIHQATQTISGIVSATEAAAGATVTLYDNGGTTAVGSAIVQADGSWTITNVTLAAGTNSLVAKDTDLAGNIGSSNAVVFTLQTAAPTVAISSAGGPTNVANQTITGTVSADAEAPGSTVTLYDNGGTTAVGSAIVQADGSWTITNVTLAAGTNSLVAKDTDLAGNIGSSNAVVFTLQTAAPTVAISSAGGPTNVANQTITGTVSADAEAPGSTVTLYDNGGTTAVGSAIVQADGSWTITNVTLAAGTNSLVAKDTDLAGNIGSSNAVVFTLQTAAPTVAISSAGGPTNVANQTITGTVSADAEAPGSTVTLYDNGGTTAVGSAIVQADGSWTITNVTLAAGTNSLVAKDTDLAGNIGSSNAVVFTLQTAAPTVAISSAGGPTNVANQTITGTVSADAEAPGSTVTLYDNGGTTAVGSAIVQADGSWTITNVTLAAGTNSLVAKDTDLAGNIGSSNAVVFTLQTAAPTVAISSAGGPTNVANHTITGTVSADAEAPGSTVTLYDNGGTTAVGSAIVQADGSWTITNVTLAAGTNSLVAKDTDLAGNIGSSNAVVFTLQTAAPTVAISSAGGPTNVANQTITGTVSADAEAPGSTVTLYDNGGTTAVGSAIVQADGSWTITNVTLAAGTNSLVAKDTDLAGNIGSSKAVVYTLPNFTIQWTGPNNGNWSTGSNWSTGIVPGSLDDVLIGVPDNVVFSTGSTVVDQLNSAVGSTVTVTGGTLTVANNSNVQGSISENGGTFTDNGQMTLGGLVESGGLLNGSGTLTVSGLSTLSGGTESGTGTTIAQGGAAFTSTSFTLDGTRTLQLGGASTAAGTNVFIQLNGSTNPGSGILTIGSGATFNDQTTSSGLSIFASNFGSTDTGATAVMNNQGTFTKSGSAATSTISTTFNNSGIVNVQSGTLVLSGSGTDVGASYTGTGTIQFSGGTRTLDVASSITAANTTFSGGTTTINGTYNVAGTTTANGGTATLAGTLSSLGNALVISSGTLGLNTSSASVATLTQSGGLLNGSGTLTVSGLSTLSGGTESGTGTTIAQGGAAFTSTSFTLDGTRTLQLGGASTAAGTNVFIQLNGSTNPGSGILTIGSGATFNDQTTSSGLSIFASNFGSTDTGATAVMNNQGTFTKSGSAATSTISTTFNNSGIVNVQSGTLVLSGSGTDVGASYTGTGTIQFSGGTRTLDVASSITAANTTFSGGTTTINGTYNVAGTTTANGGTATLAGTLSSLGNALVISSGTLGLNTSSASVATLTQSGGLLNGSGTLTVSGLSTLSGGTESGTGTTIAQGGAAFTSTSFTLDGTRTLQLGGASTAAGTNVFIQLNGSTNPGSGILTIGSGATFNDQTTSSGLSIFASNFGSTDTGATAVMNNQGTFTKSGSAATSTISTTFNNSGIVNVQSGTLVLSGSGTDVGASYTGTGTIQFSGGTRTLDVASSITAANTTFSGGTTTINGTYNVAGTTTANGGTATLAGTLSSLGNALVISSGTLGLNTSSASVATLTQSGGLLNGSGTLTVSGLSTLSGGTESGTGTTIAQGGAAFTSTSFTLDGTRTLQLGGASTAAGTNVFIQLNGSTNPGSGILTIGSGATFNDQTTSSGLSIFASNFGSTDTGATAVMNNQGTFTKSGSAATSTISTTFNNSGIVNVQSGTLVLSGSGTDVGASYTGTGTIQFSGGTRTLDVASSITAANAIFSGGTTTINGTYIVAGRPRSTVARRPWRERCPAWQCISLSSARCDSTHQVLQCHADPIRRPSQRIRDADSVWAVDVVGWNGERDRNDDRTGWGGVHFHELHTGRYADAAAGRGQHGGGNQRLHPIERQHQSRLRYFDDRKRCDVQ